MAKFIFSVRTKYVGSTVSEEIHVDDEYLEDMTEEEKMKFIDELYAEWIWDGNIESHWKEVDEE